MHVVLNNVSYPVEIVKKKTNKNTYIRIKEVATKAFIVY